MLKLDLEPQKYLVAVSSGKDSMALAYACLIQKVEFGVAHCNFQLRDEESLADEKFIETWCFQHGITFHKNRFDTMTYAEDNQLSIQEAARKLRYAFFEEIRIEFKYFAILTAHHQDDNIETVIFQIARGTGLKGLTGIPAINEFIQRPLLKYFREEIETYVDTHQIPFREDSSNAKSDYTRNKIRHQVIPALMDAIPSFKNNMMENVSRWSEIYSIYVDAIQKQVSWLVEKRGNDFYLPIRKLKKVQPLQTIVYEILKPFNFQSSQLKEIMKLLDAENSKYLESSTHRLIKNRDFLIVTHKMNLTSGLFLVESSQAEIETDVFSFSIVSQAKAPEKFTNQHHEIYFDMKEIKFPLILRKWKAGDYLYPFGLNKKKKVSRVLIDAKLSLIEKEKVWVLESGRKLICILGIMLDHRFQILPSTKEICKLTFIKKN